MAQSFGNLHSGVMTRSQSLRGGRKVENMGEYSGGRDINDESDIERRVNYDVSYLENKSQSDSALNLCIDHEVRSHSNNTIDSGLRTENSKLKLKVSELNTQLNFVTSELETVRSEVVRLQLNFDSSSIELDNTRYALEFTKDELHESNRQLSNIKQELHNAQRKHHQYQTDITDAQNEIAELKGELRQLSRSHCDYSGNAGSSSMSHDNHLKYRQDTPYTYTDNRQDRYEYNHGNMSNQY